MEERQQALLCNGAVTECNVDIEINKDIEQELERRDKPKRKRFIPPTVDEVKAYADEKGYVGFDAERFMAYYESNGWKVGRNPMKDWRAAVRNWASRDKQTGGSAQSSTHKPSDYDTPDDDNIFW